MNGAVYSPETVILPVLDLNPLFPRSKQPSRIRNYRKIVSSIRELGLIEPLVVVDIEGRHYIKDGYLRWQALIELGQTKVECLISSDLDAYTYNKRVNPIAPVQTQAMIDRAVKLGVDPDRIAATLNVSRKWVKRLGNLIEGIAPEAVERLKRRVVGQKFFDELRKVKSERQMEILHLVEASDDYSPEYIKALVLTTPPQMLVAKSQSAKPERNKTHIELAGRLQVMEAEFRKASCSFRDNVFNLVKIAAYTRQLLRNNNIREFLGNNYPDILLDFEKIANDNSLNV